LELRLSSGYDNSRPENECTQLPQAALAEALSHLAVSP
jgi:hypothetical protein